MDEVLRSLLNDLETIERDHEEVSDSEVREAMRDAVHDGFISPKPNFVLGDDFAMYTAEGNAKVKAALGRFLDRAGAVAQAGEIDTPRARLDAFQNSELTSLGGNYYDDYFGYAKEPW